jgi:hypothetical protein
MNYAASLMMHRADFQFGDHLITGRVEEVEMHGGGPATKMWSVGFMVGNGKASIKKSKGRKDLVVRARKLTIDCHAVYIFSMPLDLTGLANIVVERDFARLIGEIEGQFFDAKGQPYQFDAGNDAKREFAKDVSAFANANGGYILVGIATKPAVLQAGEEVSELRPILQAHFDPDRHRKLLQEWLYPQPREIEIDWISLGEEKGIGVIFVPPQKERSKPFLISRTIGDKKTTEVMIGYAERRVDATEVRRIQELHLALRTGLNLERELLGRIENIEVQINRFFTIKTQAETDEKREQRLNARITRLLEEDNG